MPAIAFATSVSFVFLMRSVAWIFRGFRSPIRDTLLVDATDPRYVNRAFGFQRALDTVGAIIGPAAATIMVASHVPLKNAILFGFIPGLIAGVLYLWVRERPRSLPPHEPLHIVLANLPRDFKRYLLGAGVFGLGNFSATLLVLVAIRALTPSVGSVHALAYATGFYLLHNAIYAGLAYPAGVLSERLGSGRMLAVGFGVFATMCTLVAVAPASLAVVACAFVLSAVSIGIIDPMEGAFASQLLPAQRRGSGFGALAAINGVGDLVSSAGVGAAWQFLGAPIAFGSAAAACVIGLALLLPVVSRRT
jgi:MFS family permease